MVWTWAAGHNAPAVQVAAVMTVSANQGGGHPLGDARPGHEERHGQGPARDVERTQRRQRLPERAHPLHEMLRHLRDGQAEKVLHLEGPDDDGDARRETGRDRVWHELDQPAEPRQAHERQKHAREERRHQQAAQPVTRRDRRQDDHERRRRPVTWTRDPPSNAATAPPTMAVYRPCCGGTPGGDRERHRQRQRHDPDDAARHQVGPQVAARVAVCQAVTQKASRPQRGHSSPPVSASGAWVGD